MRQGEEIERIGRHIKKKECVKWYTPNIYIKRHTQRERRGKNEVQI